jgi:hypothetical protein
MTYKRLIGEMFANRGGEHTGRKDSSLASEGEMVFILHLPIAH